MSRRIRVLEVLEATAGGTARHIREILLGLGGPSIELHLACSVERDPTFVKDLDLFRTAGVSVTLLPLSRRPRLRRDFQSSRTLSSLLRTTRFDVMHLHSARAGWIGRLVSARCPVIYSPHAFPFLQRDPLRPLYRLAEHALAPRTRLLHAVCQAEADLAIESGLYAREQVRVIANGIDVKALDHGIRRGFAASAPRIVGFIGDLRLQKDPLRFVEAARIVLRTHPHTTFLLPEHGPLLPMVRERVRRLGMQGAFAYVPAEGSLDQLYEAIDLAVLPSLWEGLPYTLLEAMALRIPVISSDLPVFREMLGSIDARLLAAGPDARELARVITLWLDAPPHERRTVSERSRASVIDKHDLQRWRGAMARLYEEASALRPPIHRFTERR